MKYVNKGLVSLAVFVAVLAPAFAAGAQDPDDVDYWNAQWDTEAACFPNTHGSITDDGLAVVLAEYDPSWGGDGWVGLVVFGDDDYIAYPLPEAGVAYPAPNDAAVTSYIACKGVTTGETTTTTAAPEETSTTTTAAPEETSTTTTAAPEETTTTTAAPEETTSTTAAPAGGVAAGAGGTADSDQSALWLLGGIAAITVVAGAGYASRRRSES